MLQQQLAERLGVNQSFISAIEKGKSPFPPNKMETLYEIFGEETVRRHMREDCVGDTGSHHASISESEVMTQLLRLFHNQEHSSEEHTHIAHHKKIDEMQASIDRLLQRNDTLSERNLELQRHVDSLTSTAIKLRGEIARLREIIISAGLHDAL